MPVLLLYLLKLSIGTSLVYLFYRLLLQRLTFYQANRWYLLAYPLLCCIIPMIDVAPLVSAEGSPTNTIVYYIPVVQQYVAPTPSGTAAATVVQTGRELINPWAIVSGLLVAGMLFFSIRLLIRFASFMRIKKQAVLIGNYDVKLYKIKGNLLPFSFADGIYVNPDAYSPDELQQIIRHEQVHVTQKHTWDIILGELLCILNWYNPFAWLLRHAMRQNLEFIADNEVVSMGSNKRDYQYLLLKVTGVPVRGMVNQFNFSSLKKRIKMMNKIKSTKLHWVKFMFALPLLAFLLLACRKPLSKNDNQTTFKEVFAGIVYDIDTQLPLSGVQIRDSLSGKETVSDERGYYEFTYPLKKDTNFIVPQFFKEGYHKNFLSSLGSYQNTEPEKDKYNFMLNGIKNTAIVGGEKGSSCSGALELTDEADLYTYVRREADEFMTNKGNWAFLPTQISPHRNIKAEWENFLKQNPNVENVVRGTAKNASNITIDRLNTVSVNEGHQLVTVVLKNGEKSIYDLSKLGERARFVQNYKSPPPYNPLAMPATPSAE